MRGANFRDWGGPWDSWVESARMRLLEQRAFRTKQLEELGDPRSGRLAAAGSAEVRGALRAAARAALLDVDAALRRIEKGTYGHCPRCGESISLDRLDAVPSAPLCGACHRAVDTGEHRGLRSGLPLPPVAARTGVPVS
jgi:RNA polymerase-binding transcription factor DksA